MEEQFLGILIFIMIIAFVFLIAALLVLIFFNIAMQKAMNAVSEKNRKINPGLIWLNLIPIPILNPIWTGYFCLATCQSLNADAKAKIAPSTIAIIYLITSTLSAILGLFSWNFSMVFQGQEFENSIEEMGVAFFVITSLLSMVNFVFFIILWVNISNARKKVEAMDENSRGGGVSSEDILDAPM